MTSFVSSETFESTPTSNTGGLPSESAACSEAYSHFVIVNGKAVEVPLKRGSSRAAFIDTMTIVFSESVFIRDDQLGTEEEVACNASVVLSEIFGFGILKQNSGGRNGYKFSYHLGTESENYGFLALGGSRQNDTVCLYLSGVGLTAAKSGWETRLYEFLRDYAPYAKITRVDLAHDFLNGEYTPDLALLDWRDGGYTSRNTKPVAECVGGDWLEYRGTGKTFYIGSRKNSSRFVRIYEKGKQLGDTDSDWVRVELELHNRDIIIPHEILINAGQFLTGAFPVFERLFFSYNETPSKAERVKKQQDVSAEHCIKYGSIQVSGVINLLERMGLTPEAIVETLKNGNSDLPKRLNPAAFDCATESLIYIHEVNRVPRDVSLIVDSAFQSGGRLNHRSYDDYLNEFNIRLEQQRIEDERYFSSMWRKYGGFNVYFD